LDDRLRATEYKGELGINDLVLQLPIERLSDRQREWINETPLSGLSRMQPGSKRPAVQMIGRALLYVDSGIFPRSGVSGGI
jgi:hypothetical protein